MCASLLATAFARASALSLSSHRDCDTNAVIKCGALSTGELREKYNANSSTRAIYSFFGITSDDLNALHSNGQTGYVTKSGDVVVGGKVVARSAVTAGKQNMPSSTKVTPHGNVFFTRSPSVSFNAERLAAFVMMKDGRFDFAVIASCGNPVNASAVAQITPPQPAPPTPPAPAPVTPVTTPTQAPSPFVTQVQQVSQPVVQSVNVTQTVNTAAAPTPTTTTTPSAKTPATLPNTGLASIFAPALLVTFVTIVSYYMSSYIRRKLII